MSNGIQSAARVTGWLLRLRRTHLFHGERKGGDLKGYHHEGRRPRHTIVSIVTPPNALGVYEARWLGFGKTGKGKFSSFFPKQWTRAKVEVDVRFAAGLGINNNRLTVFRPKERWKFSEVVNGVRIEGLLSWSCQTIMTAYPIP